MAGIVLDIGIIVPQGWTGEFNGWDSVQAWARTRDVAKQAETLGFESVWLFDHFHTVPRPTEEITFESFTSLSAIAAVTSRVRLGHIVICTSFRNPALTAKMISTMDVISNGRMELGIGAGWKRDEWLAYGYGFPSTKERLAILGDHLEVITRMLRPGRATFRGEHATVDGAINMPKPVQPALPDRGRRQRPEGHVAARGPLRRRAQRRRPDGRGVPRGAARHPLTLRRDRARPRHPAPLRAPLAQATCRRPDSRESLAAYREAGASRIITLVRESADGDEALAAFAEDCRDSGATLEASTALGA